MRTKQYWVIPLIALAVLTLPLTTYGQQSVADLKYVELGNYSWIKLATIVP
jgi:hypothetical protein